MMDKPEVAEVELPPPCHDCRSLHMRSPTVPLLVALGVEPVPGLEPPPPGVGV